MAHPARALSVRVATSLQTIAAEQSLQAAIACPICLNRASGSPLERFYSYVLYECSVCRLQFWEPRNMPDAAWYSAMYGQRNSRLLPLEPGHRFFLTDPRAPRSGRLLDVGCGTGNFLRVASDAGYFASGLELDPVAANFAAGHCRRSRVFALPLESFQSHHPNEIFDVVTFFEVLEHQAEPNIFLSEIRACLRPGGFVALSVPNRERWQSSVDVLDYPPNHFLRWNSNSLQAALATHGFAVVSIKKEEPTLAYTAQQINNALLTGISRALAPELSKSFRDEMQENPEQRSKCNQVRPSLRSRAVQILGRAKYASCFPVALAALPFIKWRGISGAYLYCLARKLS